jgi:hypothetical protein
VNRVVRSLRSPLLWLAAGFCLVSVVLPVVRALEPDPLVYKNSPFPVDGPVRAGEPIPLTVDRCATGEITDFSYSRILHRVGDGPNYPLSDGSAVLIPGCTQSLSRTALVPLETEPGTYELIGVIRVAGNWREHKVIYKSQSFVVVAHAGGT